MRELILFLFGFVFLVNNSLGEQVCHSGVSDLAILKTSMLGINLNDPEGDLKKRIAHEDYRFIGLYGLGPEYPALKFPEDKPLLCFYGYKMIEGTSDALEGAKHIELVIKVGKYADIYNGKMREYLRRRN